MLPKSRVQRAKTRLMEEAEGSLKDKAVRRWIEWALLSFVILALLFIASGCGRDAEQVHTRAVEAWDSGDYKLADEQYESYLSLDQSSERAAQAQFQLANIYYFKLRKYDQARAHYAEFLDHNPSHSNAPLARERLAEVLGEMGRSYEAIAEYENLKS